MSAVEGPRQWSRRPSLPRAGLNFLSPGVTVVSGHTTERRRIDRFLAVLTVTRAGVDRMTNGTSDIESVFREAQRIDDHEERWAYVHRACQGVAAVEKIVLELLEISDGLSGVTSGSPSEDPQPKTITTPVREAEQLGRVIGRYKLLKLIGEGGFGTVFLAEQREPVRRHVALKIIKLGMDTHGVIARFEVERQALALMDHPNIAKVFDAGATETGRPYFVMELVTGEPITDYCDKHRLTIRERLDLFSQVCRAVQHAHTKGIIHRDLKPSNVLVSTHDDHPFAKVIDFGIAKAAYATLTDKTLFTDHHQLLGTPVYMSPEQAEGSEDTDTRSDVYSLGVLLYELLTGSTPFSPEDLQRAGIAEMYRVIREVEPPLPSTRIVLSSTTLPAVAASRATDPQRLRAAVHGELDWIVMKCLEKNRARRYESAGSLGSDIGHHMRGEAVLAAPPSRVYRLRKFVRRHRVGVGAGATVAAALIVGLGASLIGLRSAVRARDAETMARRQAESALEFISEMFGAVDPKLARGHDVTVAEVLDPATAKVAQSFSGDAEGEAVVRSVLAQAYSNLARYPDALREFERAWKLRQARGQVNEPEALTLLHNWGATLLASGDVSRARELLQRACDQRAATLGPAHRDTLETRSVLAYAKQLGGDLDGATDDIREVLRDQERTLGPNDRGTLESMCSLADMLGSAGKLEEALRVAHEGATRAASAYGPDSDLALMASSIEAEYLDDLSRYEEAATLLERVVRGKEKLYGSNHPETLVSLDLLAGTLLDCGQNERAIDLRRAVVDRAKQTLGEGHASTLTYMNNLAQALRHAGQLAEAEPIYRRVITLRREQDGAQAEGTLVALSNLGLLLLQREAPREALPLFREAADGLRSTLAPDNWMLGVALLNLGRCQTALRDYAVAEATLLDAHARLERSLGPSHGRTNQVRAALAKLYDAWGRPEQARIWRASK